MHADIYFRGKMKPVWDMRMVLTSEVEEKRGEECSLVGSTTPTKPNLDQPPFGRTIRDPRPILRHRSGPGLSPLTAVPRGIFGRDVALQLRKPRL